ncbi:hypothetical protein BVRB_8g187440 [Beta vulgaris subsp. vulgaris]|nr:hypothetical protein BVRB_8g187440 [Beta vulgaris subsp. vulgaris]
MASNGGWVRVSVVGLGFDGWVRVAGGWVIKEVVGWWRLGGGRLLKVAISANKACGNPTCDEIGDCC